MANLSVKIIPKQDIVFDPYFDIYEDGEWKGSKRLYCKSLCTLAQEKHDNMCFCEEMEGNWLCPQNEC